FLTLATMFWLDQGRLAQRIGGQQGDTLQSRLSIGRDSLAMVRARPMLGWGLGTFAYVYPQYQQGYSVFFADHAHDDYLQAWVETGTIGLLLVAGFLVTFLRRGISRLKGWDSQTGANFSTACWIGSVGLLVHSFSDFNLHIPANAAMFFVLVNLATGDR